MAKGARKTPEDLQKINKSLQSSFAFIVKLGFTSFVKEQNYTILTKIFCNSYGKCSQSVLEGIA
jgi:hypothetical protein